MSATLDASLFSAYFGGCPVVQAAGRSFPVALTFLEDVLEEHLPGYQLTSDSPAALRGRQGGSRVRTVEERGSPPQASWKELDSL